MSGTIFAGINRMKSSSLDWIVSRPEFLKATKTRKLAYTLPKFNLEPANGTLNRRFVLETIIFGFHVTVGECTCC